MKPITFLENTPDGFGSVGGVFSDLLFFHLPKEQVNGGYARAMWCGDRACEDKIKEETGATSRNMPFDQTPIGDTCVCCGKKADKVMYFAKAY